MGGQPNNMQYPEMPQNYQPYWGNSGNFLAGSSTLPDYADVLQQNKDLNFVQRLYNKDQYPTIKNEKGGYSTHRMASSDNLAYPTIIYDSETKKLKQLSGEEARQHALKTGEFIEFSNPYQANDFANNGYKRSFPKGYF